MMRSYLPALGVAALVLGAIACANPADNVPAAGVSTPTEAPAAVAGKVFTIDEPSSIGFIGSKITGSHNGGFSGFEGEISLVGGDVTKSTVNLSIDTTTLWADNEQLTGHLKSADFFDVAAHPQATFTSTEIKPAAGSYLITGNLDLHGVTKSISFPAQIDVQEDRITARTEFSIMRFDFGIAYKGKADDLIRDEVVIKLDITAMAQGSAS
jgi:polyisoprenoid-binding protein YceI